MAGNRIEFGLTEPIWYIKLPEKEATRVGRRYIPDLNQGGYTFGEAVRARTIRGGVGSIVPYRPLKQTLENR